MQSYVVKKLLMTILSVASEAILRALAEETIKICRKLVVESENKVDDVIVLPMLTQLEAAFQLNDDD